MTWKGFWDWVFGRGTTKVAAPAPQKPRRAKQRLPRCVQIDKVSRTEKDAKDRAKQLDIRAYKCEFCPYWHLTHKKNKMMMH